MAGVATKGIANDRYVVISADCHAGGSMEQYRSYLESRYHEQFDAWRGAYSNPFRDLQGGGRTRNWDDERRFGDLTADGIVGEVVFPNTVPPFFPTGALVARPPAAADLELRWAGLRAHNRWLADWCAAHPERRAGIAQVFLNDVDAAIEQARFAAEHGLRGGILVPAVPDDTDIPPLFTDHYDPLWRVCEELGVTINQHGGSGHPDYGSAPASGMMWLIETGWFAHRPFWQLVMSGVFERFPDLRLVMTEQGCAWLVPTLRMLDGFHAQAASGRVGELKFAEGSRLSLTPSEYFRRNCYVGVSFPSPSEARAMQALGIERMMWGSDYPHHEGTTPYSREALRRSFSDWEPDALSRVLSGTACEVYGFDLDALAPVAAEVGPGVVDVARPLDAVPDGATSPAFFQQ